MCVIDVVIDVVISDRRSRASRRRFGWLVVICVCVWIDLCCLCGVCMFLCVDVLCMSGSKCWMWCWCMCVCCWVCVGVIWMLCLS